MGSDVDFHQKFVSGFFFAVRAGKETLALSILVQSKFCEGGKLFLAVFTKKGLNNIVGMKVNPQGVSPGKLSVTPGTGVGFHSQVKWHVRSQLLLCPVFP